MTSEAVRRWRFKPEALLIIVGKGNLDRRGTIFPVLRPLKGSMAGEEGESPGLEPLASGEFPRSIAESATEWALVAAHAAGRVTYWTIRTELLFGFDESITLGCSLETTTTPNDRAPGVWKTGMDEAREQGRVLVERRQLRQDDGTGERTMSGSRWSAYTGLSEPDNAGLGWLQAIHPEDRAATLQGWEAAAASGDYLVEHRIRSAADGAFRWSQTSAAPLPAPLDELTEQVGLHARCPPDSSPAPQSPLHG